MRGDNDCFGTFCLEVTTRYLYFAGGMAGVCWGPPSSRFMNALTATKATTAITARIMIRFVSIDIFYSLPILYITSRNLRAAFFGPFKIPILLIPPPFYGKPKSETAVLCRRIPRGYQLTSRILCIIIRLYICNVIKIVSARHLRLYKESNRFPYTASCE